MEKPTAGTAGTPQTAYGITWEFDKTNTALQGGEHYFYHDIHYSSSPCSLRRVVAFGAIHSCDPCPKSLFVTLFLLYPDTRNLDVSPTDFHL